MNDKTEMTPAALAEPTASTPERIRLATDPVSLAREMGRAYQEMLTYYSKEMSPAEADARTRDPAGADLERMLETPADQLSWWALGRIAGRDPEQARTLWERAITQAFHELASGHRAAKSVEATSSPWERAQFLAILESFVTDLQPRGGVESALVDTLAQAHTMSLRWLARLTVLSNTEGQRQDREIEEDGVWRPATVDTAAALDQAAAMVDRFNRLFTRTLRALRDLRRYTPQMVVQNVGQLNLAQSQVNIGRTEPESTDHVKAAGT